MFSGQLDRRLTIQRVTEAQDAYGDAVETWADLITLWANVRQAGTNETFRSGRRMDENVTAFTIRHRTGLTVKDRVSYEGGSYDITGIKEIGRRAFLELTAVKRA